MQKISKRHWTNANKQDKIVLEEKNMNIGKQLFSSTVAVLLICSVASAGTQTITEPIGGKPPAGMNPSIKDYNYRTKYMYAFEAAIWAMPAVGIYGFRKATDAVGGEDNTILAWSKPADAKAELLTANDNTPYI